MGPSNLNQRFSDTDIQSKKLRGNQKQRHLRHDRPHLRHQELAEHRTLHAGIWTLESQDNDRATYQNFMTHFNLMNINRLLTTTTTEAGYSATTNQPKKETKAPNANNKENERNNGSITGYHYFWTHGINKTHKGMQCNYPKEGHIKEATIGNMQGGCVFIYQPVNKCRSCNPSTQITPVA
jgi:hypothetical protein